VPACAARIALVPARTWYSSVMFWYRARNYKSKIIYCKNRARLIPLARPV